MFKYQFRENRSRGTRVVAWGWRTEGRTDRQTYGEANSRLSQCWQNAYKGSWGYCNKIWILKWHTGCTTQTFATWFPGTLTAWYEGLFTYPNPMLPHLLSVSVNAPLFVTLTFVTAFTNELHRAVCDDWSQSIYWHVVPVRQSLCCTSLIADSSETWMYFDDSQRTVFQLCTWGTDSAVSSHLVAAVCKLWNSLHVCDFLSSPGA
jgi:hypothetical protein